MWDRWQKGDSRASIARLFDREHSSVERSDRTPQWSPEQIAGWLKRMHQLPKEQYKSLTWDRRSEMADHKRFTLVTDIQVHFCDPQSPWRRGPNENTNRLLRQYIPKGTDLSVHSQVKLNAVARQLNECPGKTLDYATPAEHFNHCVASTD